MFQTVFKYASVLVVLAALYGFVGLTATLAHASPENVAEQTEQKKQPEQQQDTDSKAEDKTAEKAADSGPKSGLPLPRFVSLGSNEVNMRVGPGLKYPITWVLTREGLTVEIVREFDAWREIRTKDGDQGWVHQSLLSGKRTAIIDRYIRRIHKSPSRDSRPLAEIEPGVIVAVNACEVEWCNTEILNYDGWIQKDGLWGVYPYEKFD
jgi:SH3-like domain-containing protein